MSTLTKNPSSRAARWRQGKPATSIKALNASAADALPSSNAAISRSLASFTRILLGYEELNRVYPPKPTSAELKQLPTLTQQEIFLDRRVFASISVDSAAPKKETRFKDLIRSDLQNWGIPRFTFAWDLADSHSWNRTMSIFVVKHWRHAQQQGEFDSQGINTSCITESICIGLVLRWIRGRAEDIRLGRGDLVSQLRRERQRKRRMLFRYRAETIKRHLKTDSSLLLPNADCCSDTEWDPEALKYPRVGLRWRSQSYEDFLQNKIDGLSFSYKSRVSGLTQATQRFDQCRLPATYTNDNAAVCCGLPANFYDTIFLSSLTEEQKVSLQMKPPLDLRAISEEVDRCIS